MRQLKTFSFKHEYPGGNVDDDDDDDQDAESVIHEFLSACLETSNLQYLSLDLRGDYEGGHFPLRLGQIIGRNKTLHKLTDIFLGRVALDYADLIAFLKTIRAADSSPKISRNGLSSCDWSTSASQ